MVIDPEIESLKKDMFVANEKNAPHCFRLSSNFELRLLVDIHKRISTNIDIFENYNGFMIEKIKHLILPTLLRDKLIKEDVNGFSVVHKNILFETSNKKERIQRIAGALEGSLDVMNEKNLKDSKMFYLNYKKVPKEKYDDIINDRNNLLKKILKLQEFENTGSVDCEFTYFSFYNQRKD